MKRLLLILFLSLFTSSLSFSQLQPSIEISKPYPIVSSTKDIFLKYENNILASRKNKIQVWDINNLDMLKSIDLNIPKGSFIEELCNVKNEVIVFYSHYNKENQYEELYLLKIDIDDAKPVSEPKLVLKSKRRIAKNFNFNYSNRNSNVFIQYRLTPIEKRDEFNFDIIGLCLLDSNLNTVYNKEIRMPYNEKKMDNIDYLGVSNGDAFILTKVFYDNTRKNINMLGQINYSFELLKIAKDSLSYIKMPLDISDKHLGSIRINEVDSGNILCAGYTYKGRATDNVDGAIYFKINNQGKVFDLKQCPIPISIIGQYSYDLEDERPEFEELQLRHLVFNADGSQLLIGEKSYKVAHWGGNGRAAYFYFTYHYDDILVIKLNKEGNLEWMKKLPKKQKGMTGQGGQSFKYMSGSNCHYFLFLDNIKNKDLSVIDQPKQHVNAMGGYLAAYKIDDNIGEVTKEYILNTANVNELEIFKFSINRILPLSFNSFVFEVYKKEKEDLLIKVTLNE